MGFVLLSVTLQPGWLLTLWGDLSAYRWKKMRWCLRCISFVLLLVTLQPGWLFALLGWLSALEDSAWNGVEVIGQMGIADRLDG